MMSLSEIIFEILFHPKNYEDDNDVKHVYYYHKFRDEEISMLMIVIITECRQTLIGSINYDYKKHLSNTRS